MLPWDLCNAKQTVKLCAITL
ncbi:hypothetical protein EMIT0P43_90246 [Pseudomonas jessenii]